MHGPRNVKTRISVCLFLLLLLVPSASATTVPSTAYLTSQADLIVVGKVLDVDKPGDSTRQVTASVADVIKGNISVERVNTIALVYQRIGKGNIDFQNMKEAGTNYIFFLKYVPDPGVNAVTRSFHIELVDVWFGAQESDSAVIGTIKGRVQRSAQAYDEMSE